MKKIGIHAIRITAVLAVVTLLLLYAGGALTGAGFGGDAVSSASVGVDQPSGAYVVWINRSLHTNEENLLTWQDFFAGEEIGYLFEDISCVVAGGDMTGIDLAASFQSRLPENQMTVRTEDATLMLSKALEGRFDVLILSKEFYDRFQAQKLFDEGTAVQVISEGV